MSVLPHADRCRLAPSDGDAEDPKWVEKLPTPAFQSLVPEVVALLDEHTQNTNLRYPWSILRDSLHACHLYVSRRAILIRPLIPPSNTHSPFAGRLPIRCTCQPPWDQEAIWSELLGVIRSTRSLILQLAGTNKELDGGSSSSQSDHSMILKRRHCQSAR